MMDSYEEQRLRALEESNLLDSLPEQEFDEIVALAAAICGTPISLISLVDRDRQWFKSVFGLDVQQTPRSVSFCAHAIQQHDLFVVEDAREDDRFRDNALVTGRPDIRFYAGFPLRDTKGFALGTLCVIDRRPRILTPDQRHALEVLSHQVKARIDLRAQRTALEKSLAQKDELALSLRASESLFRTFMQNSPFLSYIKDADGRMLFYNGEFARQFNISLDEWLGKRDHELWPAAEAHVFRTHDLEVLNGRKRVEYQEEAHSPDGRVAHYHSIKFPYEDGDGHMLLAGVSVDITQEILRNQELARYQEQLEAANAQLSELAVTDALTGLKNRRAFNHRLEAEFSSARRKGRNLSIVLIDIDNFKLVNDQLGHPAGDRVLKQLAAILESSAHQAGIAVRYGGEEFAVLLPGSDAAQAVEWAARLRLAIHATPFPDRQITVSMGVSDRGDARTGEQMVDRADEALYAAKHGGKDMVLRYEPHFRPAKVR